MSTAVIPYISKTIRIYSTTDEINLSVKVISKTPANTDIIYTAEIEGEKYNLTPEPKPIAVIAGWIDVKLKAELIQDGRNTPTLKSMFLVYRNVGHVTDCLETKPGGGIFDIPFVPGTTLSLWAKSANEVLNYDGLSIIGDDLWNYYSLRKDANSIVSLFINGEKKGEWELTGTEPIYLGYYGACRLSDMQFTNGLVSQDEIKQHFRVKLPYYDKNLLENLSSSVVITPDGMWLEGNDSAIEFIPKEGIARFTNIDFESNYKQGVSGYKLSKKGDAEFNDITVRGNITGGSKIGGWKVYPFHVGQTIDGDLITQEMVGSIRGASEVGNDPQLTDTQLTSNQIDDMGINAGKVNGHYVNETVPTDAEFTDTQNALVTDVQGKIITIDGAQVDSVTVNGYQVEKAVPSDAEFTDTTYQIGTDAQGKIITIDGVDIIDTNLDVVLNEAQTAIISIGGNSVDASLVNGFDIEKSVPLDADFTNSQHSETAIQQMIFDYLSKKGFTVNQNDTTITADNLIVRNGDFSGAIDAGPLLLSRQVPVEISRSWQSTITIKALVSNLKTDYGIISTAVLQGSLMVGGTLRSYDNIKIIISENVQHVPAESTNFLTYGYYGGGEPSWYSSSNPGMQKLIYEYKSGGRVKSYYKYITKGYAVYRLYHTYSISLYSGGTLVASLVDTGNYIDHIISKEAVRVVNDGLDQLSYPSTTISNVEDATKTIAGTFEISSQTDSYTYKLRNIPNSLDTSNYEAGLVYRHSITGALYAK